NAYVIGTTRSTDFPAVNAAQGSPGGGSKDVFVTKLNPSGSAIVYSTYLGGNDQEEGLDIAADAMGNAYATGWTYSKNFPVKNALQATNLGFSNVFVVKLNPSGAFVFSTYLGGRRSDR